jgi:hypothetical protein
MAFLGAGITAVGNGAYTVYSVYKDLREERRLGLVSAPAVTLGFPGQNCTLINEDRRPVAEATIAFSTYVVDASECSINSAISGSHVSPSAATSQLVPRDRLQFITDELVSDGCRLAREPNICPQGHDCRLMVECEAQYLRQADLEPFHARALALSSKDCKQIRGVETLYTYGVKNSSWTLSWRDAADERAVKCFMRSRSRVDGLRDQHNEIIKQSRDAFDRDVQRAR